MPKKNSLLGRIGRLIFRFSLEIIFLLGIAMLVIDDKFLTFKIPFPILGIILIVSSLSIRIILMVNNEIKKTTNND